MIRNKILGLIVSALTLASSASAQQYNGPIFDVIHIDVMPQYIAEAVFALDKYRDETLTEDGASSCKVLQEAGRSNHFTIEEEWARQSDYDAHISNDHARRFRDKIQPLLGAPIDERLHTELPPTLQGETRRRR